MLLDAIYLALEVTAFLVGITASICSVLWIAPLLGRPLIRRIFGLAHSNDPSALAETGGFATLLLVILMIGIFAFNCGRETSTTGLELFHWDGRIQLRVLAESVIAAVLVEGMLSALALMVPRSETRRGGGRRLTKPSEVLASM